SKIQF
ncbi:chlamydia polymorphic membrane middle domain protein, partial [Chlamydia ibidis]